MPWGSLLLLLVRRLRVPKEAIPLLLCNEFRHITEAQLLIADYFDLVVDLLLEGGSSAAKKGRLRAEIAVFSLHFDG